MKKLMLMPLLAGMVWVCSASPIVNNTQSSLEKISQLNIDAELLKEIFTEAVPLFKSHYGIDTTVPELQIGYNDGTVSVTEIAGGNSWRVDLAGSDLIVTLGDYF